MEHEAKEEARALARRLSDAIDSGDIAKMAKALEAALVVQDLHECAAELRRLADSAGASS